VALSLWIGGVTFYGAVVVPAGTKVLGSSTAQGFVTQVVTTRLNTIAFVALAMLAWTTLASRNRRWALAASWGVMLAAQIVLVVLHPHLDAMLDREAHRVFDHGAFYTPHRVYLLITAAQWLAAVVHAALSIAAWRAEDHLVEAPAVTDLPSA
jgi:hypothetical protein